MGVACFSKPLAMVRRRLGILVHPHPPSPVNEHDSTCFSRTQGPSSIIELSVVLCQSKTTALTPMVSVDSNKTSGKNKQDGNTRKNNCIQPATTAALGRSSNGSFKQRAKSRRGSRVSLAFAPRAPSVTSDTSSGVDLMSGFCALASLTTYETKLIPDIWRSCLANNKSFCDHVLSRLFSLHPELESMFDGGVLACPMTARSPCAVPPDLAEGVDSRKIIKKKARQLSAFLHRLIITHELDYDQMLAECDNLGRSHASYFYERGLQPYHWDSLAHCILQEYKKTHMDCDLNMDEKELQQLSWTHFASAIVSAIKEAFKDEVYATPAPNPTDHTTAAGEVTYRF